MDKDLKKQKYLLIMENVAENGYDTSKFNAYLKDKYGSKLLLLYKLIQRSKLRTFLLKSYRRSLRNTSPRAHNLRWLRTATRLPCLIPRLCKLLRRLPYLTHRLCKLLPPRPSRSTRLRPCSTINLRGP